MKGPVTAIAICLSACSFNRQINQNYRKTT
jgi:hypothetical protein